MLIETLVMVASRLGPKIARLKVTDVEVKALRRPEALPTAVVKQLPINAMMSTIDAPSRGQTIINMHGHASVYRSKTRFQIRPRPIR